MIPLHVAGMLIETFGEAISMKIVISSGVPRRWCLL